MNVQVDGHYRDRSGVLVRCTSIDDDGYYVCYVIGPVQDGLIKRREVFSNGRFILNREHNLDLVEEIK